MKVKIRHIHPQAKAPKYATEGSAGADLCAILPHETYLHPGVKYTVPTGIAIELPEGYEAQIRPRSGLAAKHGVTVLNAPGTIDSDYRGEIKVILINHGDEAFTLNSGDRIAQMVVAKCARAEFVECDLDETERGAGGFGSTGV